MPLVSIVRRWLVFSARSRSRIRTPTCLRSSRTRWKWAISFARMMLSARRASGSKGAPISAFARRGRSATSLFASTTSACAWSSGCGCGLSILLLEPRSATSRGATVPEDIPDLMVFAVSMASSPAWSAACVSTATTLSSGSTPLPTSRPTEKAAVLSLSLRCPSGALATASASRSRAASAYRVLLLLLFHSGRSEASGDGLTTTRSSSHGGASAGSIWLGR